MKRSKEELELAVKESKNYSDVCRYFGIVAKGANLINVKREIQNYKISISHFTDYVWNKGLRYQTQGIKSLDEILVEDSEYPSLKLKQRLIRCGLKEHKCECCGNTEWNGQQIPIELHHINGNHHDNRLENLQILCPNCHALTKTYRGANQERYKNRKQTSKILTEEEYVEHRRQQLKKSSNEANVVTRQTKVCPICGKEFIPKTKTQKYCSCECSNKALSKKPTKEEILKDIETLGLNQSKIGQKYNVTANAVKKWLKSYDLYGEKYAYHNRISKPINQYDLEMNFIKKYDSISQVHRETHLSIQYCLQGKNKTCGGFIWEYAED